MIIATASIVFVDSTTDREIELSLNKSSKFLCGLLDTFLQCDKISDYIGLILPLAPIGYNR
jgi:hypothetical protein